MSILRPLPFTALAARVFRELDARGSLFDLPTRRFVRGSENHDLSVSLGDRVAASPVGPAAGPHTQLAQNLVLSWLAGGRVMELKTVQRLDRLVIPRPCIDAREAVLNCEWSQELTLAESLDEYVKGALLIAMVSASGLAGVRADFTDTVFEASVGYDLAGVSGERVGAFLRGLTDVRPTVERLRAELPPSLRRHAEVNVPTALVASVTVSTFHGCPPDEVEAIAAHLMEQHGLDCVVKLNPTLLGPTLLRGLLHDALGYTQHRVPDEAFARDLDFETAVALLDRLAARAHRLGRRFGAKLTNTLVVENGAGLLPPEAREVYLSGAPLHVLAVRLVRDLRRALPALPLSFSGGLDAQNVADIVALDLAPATVCSDWLKAGGYGRGARMYESLLARMDAVGARTREGLILRAYGEAAGALTQAGVVGERASRCLAALAESDARARAVAGEDLWREWSRHAARRNTERYASRAESDPRYRRDHRERAPKKVGTHLALFDCLTCDKCVAACPNDANFAFVVPHLEIAVEKAARRDGRWTTRREGTLHVHERHQVGHFADLCNDCGNCDVACPEDGGPQLVKPRFHGSLEALRADPHGTGVVLRRTPDGYAAHARFERDREVCLTVAGSRARYEGDGFSLRFDPDAIADTLDGEADGEVDLTPARILHTLAKAVLAPREVNPVSTLP